MEVFHVGVKYIKVPKCHLLNRETALISCPGSSCIMTIRGEEHDLSTRTDWSVIWGFRCNYGVCN